MANRDEYVKALEGLYRASRADWDEYGCRDENCDGYAGLPGGDEICDVCTARALVDAHVGNLVREGEERRR